MTKTQNKNKSPSKSPADSRHISMAYNLGSTTRKILDGADNVTASIDRTVRTATGSLNERVSKIRASHRSKSMVSYKRDNLSPNDAKELLTPILQDMKKIADISGLTSALLEMKERALRHSDDPVFTQLISSVEHLDPLQQEELARKFIARFNANAYLNERMKSMYLFKEADILTPKDSDKIKNALMVCIYQTFKDLGFEHDFQYIQNLSDDISEPLNDLIQFYLDPQTLSQKLSRLWKIQRIGFKTLMIINKTNEIVDIY